MKKSANRINFRYGFVVALLAICMLFLGVFIGSRRMAEVEAQGYYPERQKFYTSIEVEEGDTLWAIADEYMTEEYEDREAFMDEVREMNNLTGSIIRTGSTLLVPYYGEVGPQMADTMH